MGGGDVEQVKTEECQPGLKRESATRRAVGRGLVGLVGLVSGSGRSDLPLIRTNASPSKGLRSSRGRRRTDHLNRPASLSVVPLAPKRQLPM